MRPRLDRALDTTNFRGRVADALRKALDESGQTQTDVANKLKVKPSYISQIMAGKVNLTLDKVTEIEEALGQSLHFL